jgi:bacterioferritin (cytochrome b1)
MSQLPNNNKTPFRPTLAGCIARDGRLARAVGECYQCALYGIAAYLWRSMMSETQDRELSMLFDCIARDEIEQFRLLGELILALGSNPTVKTQVRVSPLEWREGVCGSHEAAIRTMLEESVQLEKNASDRLQTLMGGTEDRVVRSLFAYLISDAQRHIEHLRAAIC